MNHKNNNEDLGIEKESVVSVARRDITGGNVPTKTRIRMLKTRTRPRGQIVRQMLVRWQQDHC